MQLVMLFLLLFCVAKKCHNYHVTYSPHDLLNNNEPFTSTESSKHSKTDDLQTKASTMLSSLSKPFENIDKSKLNGIQKLRTRRNKPHLNNRNKAEETTFPSPSFPVSEVADQTAHVQYADPQNIDSYSSSPQISPAVSLNQQQQFQDFNNDLLMQLTRRQLHISDTDSSQMSNPSVQFLPIFTADPLANQYSSYNPVTSESHRLQKRVYQPTSKLPTNTANYASFASNLAPQTQPMLLAVQPNYQLIDQINTDLFGNIVPGTTNPIATSSSSHSLLEMGDRALTKIKHWSSELLGSKSSLSRQINEVLSVVSDVAIVTLVGLPILALLGAGASSLGLPFSMNRKLELKNKAVESKIGIKSTGRAKLDLTPSKTSPSEPVASLRVFGKRAKVSSFLERAGEELGNMRNLLEITKQLEAAFRKFGVDQKECKQLILCELGSEQTHQGTESNLIRQGRLMRNRRSIVSVEKLTKRPLKRANSKHWTPTIEKLSAKEVIETRRLIEDTTPLSIANELTEIISNTLSTFAPSSTQIQETNTTTNSPPTSSTASITSLSSLTKKMQSSHKRKVSSNNKKKISTKSHFPIRDSIKSNSIIASPLGWFSYSEGPVKNIWSSVESRSYWFERLLPRLEQLLPRIENLLRRLTELKPSSYRRSSDIKWLDAINPMWLRASSLQERASNLINEMRSKGSFIWLKQENKSVPLNGQQLHQSHYQIDLPIRLKRSTSQTTELKQTLLELLEQQQRLQSQERFSISRIWLGAYLGAFEFGQKNMASTCLTRYSRCGVRDSSLISISSHSNKTSSSISNHIDRQSGQ